MIELVEDLDAHRLDGRSFWTWAATSDISLRITEYLDITNRIDQKLLNSKVVYLSNF